MRTISRCMSLAVALVPVPVASFGGLENIQFGHHSVDLLKSYTDTLAAHPLATKMATGATLAVAGDAIAQSREPEEYDTRRASSFMLFDMAYRATQHTLFPIIVKECHGQFILGALSSLPYLASMISIENSAAMERTLASQLGIVPFLYYPVFFSLTGAMQGLSVEGSINRAKENFFPLMKRNLLFWIPVQFIQFGFVEDNLQIPFLSVCGLAWTFILSVMAGSAKSYNEDDQESATTGASATQTASSISDLIEVGEIVDPAAIEIIDLSDSSSITPQIMLEEGSNPKTEERQNELVLK